MLDMAHYVDKSHLITQVARAWETGAGSGILGAVKVRLAEVRAEIENRPLISEDIKKDIRFLLGVQEGLRWIERLQAEALELVERLEQNERDDQ